MRRWVRAFVVLLTSLFALGTAAAGNDSLKVQEVVGLVAIRRTHQAVSSAFPGWVAEFLIHEWGNPTPRQYATVVVRYRPCPDSLPVSSREWANRAVAGYQAVARRKIALPWETLVLRVECSANWSADAVGTTLFEAALPCTVLADSVVSVTDILRQWTVIVPGAAGFRTGDRH